MPVCTYCATHIQPLQELPTEEVAECIGIVRQDQVSCFGITIGSGSGSVRAHKGGASECDMGGKCRPPSLRFDQCAIEQRSLHTTQREMLKIGSNAPEICLLYTSDAADERSSVDLGGRRIIKNKKRKRKNNYLWRL